MKIYSNLEKIAEVIGWIRIFLSITVFFSLIGFIIYFSFNLIVIPILLSCGGLIIGVIFATKQWKKTGTNMFLSRTMNMTEVDKIQDNEKL